MSEDQGVVAKAQQILEESLLPAHHMCPSSSGIS
jgi:hypothetical protein